MDEQQININGDILTANSEEDHKRAMLFYVFDVFDMDLEKEIYLYRKCQKKENRHAEDMSISQ